MAETLKIPATKTAEPTSPTHLLKRGRELWSRVMAEYHLEDAHERELLTLACEALDHVERHTRAIKRDGLISVGKLGNTIVHPSDKAARAWSATFKSLMRELGLGASDAHGNDQRPPHYLPSYR